MRLHRLASWPVLTGLVAFATLGAGCSSEPAMAPADLLAPAGTLDPARDAGPGLDRAGDPFQGPGLVDLSLDRLTVVEGAFRVRTTLTGQEPGGWAEGTFSIERRVVGLSTPAFGGPTYVRESVRHLEETGPIASQDLWRQDKSGLYLHQGDEAAMRVARRRVARAASAATSPDAGVAAAFDRAIAALDAKREAILAGPPGGALSSEITFLRYPLRKGASWEGRPGFNVWTVEGHDRLELPEGTRRAARLSIVLPQDFGPDDRALTWWDEPGEVKREFHLFGDATDENGIVIGTVETWETFELVTYTPGEAL